MIFSFNASSKLEWMVVPKEPLWKKRRFITICMDGPWAPLADLPSVFRTTPMSIISGKELTKSRSQMSLKRHDDDFVSTESLLREAYEEHPAIYEDLVRGLQGHVWGFRVEGDQVHEYFYTVKDGEVSSHTRTRPR